MKRAFPCLGQIINMEGSKLAWCESSQKVMQEQLLIQPQHRLLGQKCYPYFWAIGSSSHRKQNSFLPTGSKDAGKICTILSLLVVIRFFIIQVVLRIRKLGSCILPAVLSHAPCCRSVFSAVCSKAAKLKTKSRFQIKATANYSFLEVAENI